VNKMIERLGTSPKSFQHAIEQALGHLASTGQNVIDLKILEQRASVKNGTITDYHVKIRAAIQSSPAQTEQASGHFCPTCQQPAAQNGHLCFPADTRDKKCDWCGALIVNERHMCNEKSKKLTYICNSCGRLAISAEHLCHPEKIK